ncbi:hypothetical protein GZH47_22225 [Paenibacillus rhizovicinus]|uniref:DUF3139 domain-containing protein n=1 Tax=Paenibacillus rhizovicinus TaxID=2704463 RepID=A0A6C0P466_9BACL|nr:hypothetical protein [Paenibacillus rhizovicinus]QHW33235.1 hypothetical protein GZH47_22225 [Paenibacillus rhizovicinus]
MRSNTRYLIILIAILLGIGLAYYSYNQYQIINSNKYKALKYLKENNKTQTFEYVGESKEECYMMVGCETEVYFKGEDNREKITVLIHNGKVVPMLPLNKIME